MSALDNLVPYEYAVGDEVSGRGFSGAVVARPGPYSVTIARVDGKVTVSVTQIAGCVRYADRKTAERVEKTGQGELF